jgi:hypothetical protein
MQGVMRPADVWRGAITAYQQLGCNLFFARFGERRVFGNAGSRPRVRSFYLTGSSSETTHLLVEAVIFGSPIVSCVVAFVLARRGRSSSFATLGGFFSGMLILVGAFFTDLADTLGPLVLAIIPYMLVLAAGGIIGNFFGSPSKPRAS